jgi:UMF1 family MFS transporter
MNGRRREQVGWYFYDFANSAFSSTVVTLLLGPYILELARAAAGPDGMIHPLGVAIDPRAWWSYLIALSVAMQVVALPVAGAAADRSPNKKRLLGLWAYAGAASTAALFFMQGDMYLLAGGLFLVANVTFGASVVVYNSFLPEIAKPEERDAVSSKGWALGYLGGGIALALNLLLFAKAESLGISKAMAARINLASAGVWWAVFALIPLATLRNRPPRETGGGARQEFLQLFRTIRGMKAHPQMLMFLVAYLLYNDAVQAIIALAGQFGSDELKIGMDMLALAILMVQFVAFLGALLFNRVARAIGAKSAILVSLVIWTVVLGSVYFSVRSTAQFFVLAAIIGAVMGGTQALSRSLFSQMVPKGREAEYFGIYEISDKGTSWMAPVFFGLALQFTGSYRAAILSLIVFFLAGLAVLVRVDVGKAMQEAAGETER